MGCFDAVLWVNDQGSTGNLWLRSGTEGSSQYDFYSVVEHETDEILGTASCVANGTTNPATDGCQNPHTINGTNNNVSAADLFRYTCGSTSRNFGNLAASACFSVDGGNTDLKQYNNTNNGDDYGDWATSCANVQDAIGCQGPTAGFSHDIAANAEIELLNAAGFSLNAGVPEPGTFVLVGATLLGAGWLIRRKRK